MKVAVYDNPATMARELWQDGQMIGHTTASLLLTRGFRGDRSWDFRFNVGEWSPGAVCGDRGAMDEPPA